MALFPYRRCALWRATLVVGLGAGLLWLAARPSAQAVSAPELIAALLLNFAKLTEWPASVVTPDAQIALCTTDPDVAAALPAVIRGKSVASHPVTASHVKLEPFPKQCAVLYTSGLDNRRLASLLAALRGTSVLSVGDSDAFVKGGGIIHLYMAGDMMRFAVNVTAAERAGLRLSSRVLNMATIVREP